MEVYIGMRVEAWYDEDGFQGAWFEGTIIGRVHNGERPKYFVCYDHFINNKWDRKPLIEEFFIEYLRPIPPPNNLPNFIPKQYCVELFDNDC